LRGGFFRRGCGHQLSQQLGGAFVRPAGTGANAHRNIERRAAVFVLGVELGA